MEPSRGPLLLRGAPVHLALRSLGRPRVRKLLGKVLTVESAEHQVLHLRFGILGMAALDPVERDRSRVVAHANGSSEPAGTAEPSHGIDLRTCRIARGIADHGVMLARR